MKNPLLEAFPKPYKTPIFQSIKDSHFVPAIESSIQIARDEIQEILSIDQKKADFENTIVALERSGELLDRNTSILFNLNSAETSKELQKITQEIAPKLSEFSNDIRLDVELFKRVESVFKQKKSYHLNGEEKKLLEQTYKSFTRNGANLSDSDKEVLRNIDQELSKLSLQFSENVLAETNAYVMQITEESDLAGLPDFMIHAAKEEAVRQGKDGWVFTLQYPSYIPFMKYAAKRELREKLYKAFGSRCFGKENHDNQDLIFSIVKKRKERSNLLGYNSHSDFVLEERMAKSQNHVEDFLHRLLEKAKPFAQKEIEALQGLAQELDHLTDLQSWDHSYYAEKLKERKFNFSEDELKPYFSLENVIKGAFGLAHRLFSIQFREISNAIDVYHEDVKTYEVLDENQNHLAILYADFFPRAGKRPGAWMTSFQNQYQKNSNNIRPQISIVCNFSKPIEDKPSLLTFNEVTTLFHEFGHALHGILANTTFKSLSGTNVSWDFVELPSQLMENFCYEPEVLKTFAFHYKTGNIIPQDYIDKVKKASNFMEAYQTIRQISFGLLDLAWHSLEQTPISVQKFEQNLFKHTNLYPQIKEVNMSCSFSHIFAGGYSAGYYSYKWAELLDADAFEYVKSHGLFDEKISKKLKTLLSSGASRNPMDLYVDFRGEQPNENAMLKRAGLNEL